MSKITKKSWDWDQLTKDLRAGTRSVSFTKTDGTVRTMRCTLAESLVPPAVSAGTRKPNPAVMVVWDLDKTAWRSFRKDSVIDVA